MPHSIFNNRIPIFRNWYAVCAEHYSELEQQGFSLDLEISPNHLHAKVDKALLKRVLENLLSNAGKYNTEGQWIGVTVFETKDAVVISVADDGERIPYHEQDRLFDAFSRGDQAGTTKGGSGLGLAISRRIIEKHGGTLTYFDHDGKNCFVIRLPQ